MEEQKEKRAQLSCPYCDEEIMAADFTYCRACGITMFYCPKCRKPFPRKNTACPHCGAKLRD